MFILSHSILVNIPRLENNRNPFQAAVTALEQRNMRLLNQSCKKMGGGGVGGGGGGGGGAPELCNYDIMDVYLEQEIVEEETAMS